MSFDKATAVLAVDGGGTRSAFALDVGDRMFSVEGGAANAHSDFDGAVSCVLQGVKELTEVADLTNDDLFSVRAFLGLAGVTSDEKRERLRAALPFTRVVIEDDRRAAVRGALGQADGFVAHCGTGSFFASQSEGRQRFCGGWGAVLGDEASGFWMGRRVLSAVLEHIDGRRQCAALADRVLAQLRDAEGIIAFASGATASQIGAFAPLATELAHANDPVAQSILQEGAVIVSDNLDRIGWSSGQAICLTGGVAECYVPYLPAEKQAAVRPPLGQPIDGALALARDIAL